MSRVTGSAKHISRLAIGMAMIALGLPWTNLNGIAWADTASSSSSQAPSSSPTSIRIPFNPPQEGAPAQTRGGASRGGDACLGSPARSTLALTPLTPSTNFGLTTAEHPTFYAYIPPSSASEAFFSLNAPDGTVVYQNRVSIPAEGGIIPIQIPPTVSPLELEVDYQWGIAMLCSGRLEPGSPFVRSWVKRIEPVSAWDSSMNPAVSVEQAILYGEQGIWYDTLDTLFQLNQQSPDSPTVLEAWRELLNTVGLNAVATQPIAP